MADWPVSLQDVKDALNETTSANDGAMQGFLDGVTAVVEKMAGSVASTTVTAEQHNDVYGPRLALLERPVLSVTSITEYIGKVAYTVTVVADATTSGTYTATLDGYKGVLTRWRTGTISDWAPTVYVTYEAGRSAAPSDMRLAVVEGVRLLWAKSRGMGASEYPVSLSAVDMAYIRNLLMPSERLDGFA